MCQTDAFAILKLYKYLRVVDVCDALDGVGYFDLTLMSPEIRPLWSGMRWSAVTNSLCIPC